MWRFLALLLFSSLAAALSLETVVINGSTYYWTQNNGTISPYVLINASSKVQWSTAETNDINDALSRQSWLKYAVGFGRMQAPNQFRGVVTTDLPTFSAYAFTDNSTYWRTVFNKTITMPNGRHALVALSYEQGNYDDYVNMTIRYDMLDGTYNSLTDIYYLLAIGNITEFDKINIHFTNTTYDRFLNDSFNYTNATGVSLHGPNSPPGWDYNFEEDKANVVFVHRGQVWIGYNLGRTLAGGFQRSFRAIDVECVISCGGGTGPVTYYQATLNSTNVQVPFNVTVEVKATDSGGDCTMTNQCYWSDRSSNEYLSSAFSLAYQDTNSSESSAGSNWLRCNRDHPNDNCDWDNGDGTKKVQFYCPLESICNWQLTVQGNYTKYILSWAHSHRILFNGGVKLTETFRNIDIKAPNVTCPNNTQVVGTTYVTPCTASGPGLVNNSGIWHNQTGTWALNATYNEVDNDTVALDYTFSGLTVGNYIRYCWSANSTNRIAGLFGYNWTANLNCYEFTVIPKPPATATTKPYTPLYELPEDDDARRPIPWWAFLILGAAAYLVTRR